MKNNILLLLVFGLGILLFSCSQEEHIVEHKNSKEIISPDGFKIANSKEELSKSIFLNDEIEKGAKISSIEYSSIKNRDGAIAYINYEIEGHSKNLVYVVGNVNVSYNSPDIEVTRVNKNNYRSSNELIFRCKGSSCCYVGGTSSDNGETFYCKCENSSQNSSCTLEVTVIKDKNLSPTEP